MRRFLAILIVCWVASSCHASQPAIKASHSEPLVHRASICQILDSVPHYIGQIVHLKAHYETDNAHVEYLTEKGCAKILNISNIGLRPSGTVKGFYDATAKKCAMEHAIYLCNIEADMDVTVKIVRLPDGAPGVDLIDVHSFSLSPKKRERR